MINENYKTLYPSIVPKHSMGKCVAIMDGKVRALKIEFNTYECFWFMARDLQGYTK